MRPVSDDRARELAESLRAFLRDEAHLSYVQRMDPIDRGDHLKATAFNYIRGMSRGKGVTLETLKQALAAAADEIEKLTGGAS